MTNAPQPDLDDASREEADDPSSSAPGRTAFDALNPYGDFGGADPSGGRLLVVGLCCLLAFAGLFVAGGLWVTESLTGDESDDVSAPVVSAGAPAIPEAEPVVETAPEVLPKPLPEPLPETLLETAPEPLPEAAPEPRPETTPEKAPKKPPRVAVEAPREARAPPRRTTRHQERSSNDDHDHDRRRGARRAGANVRSARALVLSGVHDRSRAGLDGLDDALERAFLQRVAMRAPDVVVRKGGEARADDIAVTVVLTHIEEGSGGGAHDVTAYCTLGAQPRTALPDGPLRTEGKSQGAEPSAGLREQAVRRCGARLAEALRPVLHSPK